jgi:hypothetical protein
MASYGMAEYPSPQSVSDHIRMCIFGLFIRAHQYATAPDGAEFVPLGPPTAENLRQLANRYMHHPGSQVDAVCIDGTSAGRYKVTIALEVTNLL